MFDCMTHALLLGVGKLPEKWLMGEQNWIAHDKNGDVQCNAMQSPETITRKVRCKNSASLAVMVTCG